MSLDFSVCTWWLDKSAGSRERVVQVYREALEQIQLMEELGWQYVWEVEHHLPRPTERRSRPRLPMRSSSLLRSGA